MATLTLSCSSADSSTFKSKAKVKITYTASNGTLKITEIAGCRTDGYRSYNLDKNSVTVKVGTASKTVSISHGVDFTANSNYTNWGATDTSWTGLSGTSISIVVTMPSSGQAFSEAVFKGTVTMSWTTYKVTYSANGGSGAPSAQTKTYGIAITLSSAKPTRTGYTFLNWNTKSDGSGTTYASGASYTSNANITLYAIWKVNTYTINYNANGGKNAPSAQTKTYGVALTLSNVVPTRTTIEDNGTTTEYIFKGWATSSTSTSVAYKAGASYTSNASITLYAVWSKVVSVSIYDVYYNTVGGSDVLPQTKIKDETLVLRKTIPVKNGYTFIGWGLSADSTEVSYYAGDNYYFNDDIILYAIWEPWTHTVTFNANGGSGELPDGFTSTTGWGTVYIPECSLTKDGYIFKYWSTTSSGSGGDKYYVGDGYASVKNGGTVILYAIWDIKNIILYANGECKAGEFIEDDSRMFKSDGTFHYTEFIEGSPSIKVDSNAFYVSELLERVSVYLTNESGEYLTDEFGNYLTAII